MLTFKQILQHKEMYLAEVLKEPESYYAHWNKKTKETLIEHTMLTLNYAIQLIESNQLEVIIDRLVKEVCNNNLEGKDEELKSFVKTLFLKAIIFHDFGKVNENFQVDKMENKLFKHANNGIGSDHSILSAFIFVASLFNELEKSYYTDFDKRFLLLLGLLFAHPIIKHHGKLSNLEHETFLNESLHKYLHNFKITDNINESNFKLALRCENGFLELLNSVRASFQLFSLIKINSSLLTASDYYATNEFMIGYKYNDWGTIDEVFKDKILRGTYNIEYNKSLSVKQYQCKIKKLDELKDISQENINILRNQLSCEVLDSLKKNIDNKLFYIEAPTGSGKTNLSILCVAELLKKRIDITKIFYVFPFTTLINQTSKFIRENLNLNYDELAEIHFKAPYHDNTEKDIKDDENYGERRKNYIDRLFVNYPISLISHIRFFDILTSNEKEANYLLHRVANSIVVIDEIQSYAPSQWDKINYLLNSYSEAFNITFIVMSATLPKIGKLLLGDDREQRDNFVYLVENRNQYFQNPNFKNRVNIKFDYLKDNNYSPENLLSVVFERSEAYYKKTNQVKSIVEFVTKISAHKFYEIIKNDKRFSDYSKFIISGTVLEPRRKEIIDYLKSDDCNKGKIIIVCTQVVEAGLDIDMDIGFKDKSIIDAEEQLAGRINRNASKPDCELILFNSNESLKTYKSDLRYKQHIDIKLYERILIEKDFDTFYDKVFNNINEANTEIYRANNLSDFQNQIKSMDYVEVHKQFELINGKTISIFVPLEIDVRNFSEGELRFLQNLGVIDINDSKVDGTKVWELYISIIENRNIDFFEKKIDLKILSPILSKYSFSVWNNMKQNNLLKHYSDGNELKYGLLYLQHYKEIYTYEDGLKSDIETDCNFI